VRLYYLAYKGTATHKQLIRLGTKSGAAALFAGNTPDGALAKAAGTDKTTLARLSASLDADDEIDLAAAFRRRGEELARKLAAGREWIAASDTLAARLAARALPTPMVEGIAATEAIGTAHDLPMTMDLGLALGLVPENERVATGTAGTAPQPAATFGNLDDIAAVLRKQRKQRRESTEVLQASGQLALF